MKKSLLSVVLCVALLLTAMGTMLAMPASALSGVDYMTGEVTLNEASTAAGATAAVKDGVFTFTASAAGQEAALVVSTPANLNSYPLLDIEITSTGAFDLCFNDSNNNKWIGGASDYCTTFNEGATDYEKIPAGTYSTTLNLTGAYTWNGDPLPANAEIVQVIFIAEEATTITVTKCQITDGIIDVDLNSRGDVSGLTWDKTVNLIEGAWTDCPAPNADDPQSSVTVTKTDDGVVFGNTNGMWPAAAYTFDEPIVVNDSAALELDFTVTAGSATTIYVFFGPSTPSSFGDGAYLWVAVPSDIMTTDLGPGNYKGVIFLEDTLKKTIGNLDAIDKCKDENGNYVITGVKVFGTNNNGKTENAVTMRKFNLLSLADDVPPPETTAPTTGTTKPVLNQGTQSANGNTTTVNKGNSGTGNSANTGDVSEAALFVFVAVAAAAVVTLSVVSKKVKSR